MNKKSEGAVSVRRYVKPRRDRLQTSDLLQTQEMVKKFSTRRLGALWTVYDWNVSCASVPRSWHTYDVSAKSKGTQKIRYTREQIERRLDTVARLIWTKWLIEQELGQRVEKERTE